ncbi:MAG TPA: glycine cleavage system aminomethyltransferase GcvT [Polyangiaceae bacterium]|nr:glycine cleavage system aminomethyltransferase GcvT [Polyangiaceae bacterium]
MSDALRRTPLYEEHRAAQARLVPFAGWEMPVQYQGISAEHRAVREQAGLFDVSHMGELEIKGAAALSAVNRLISNDLARIKDGQALYTCACNERGTVLDDLIVYRKSSSDILVVCNASNRGKMAAHFAEQIEDCSFRDASDDYALIALQGPRALSVLRAAGCSIDVAAALPSFRFAAAEVASVPATVAHTGYTGEDGVELFVAPEHAVTVWRALLAAGGGEVVPVGLGARDTLRLEARLSLYGNDIDETTNPLEAGLGWTVKLDKSEFLGKAALEAVKAAGISRTLVGFEMLGRGIARHGYPLLDMAGEAIGICTSGGPSPTLGKNIGLGYMPLSMREPGSRFQVDCRGKAIEAVVVATPFYKRKK